MSSCQEFLLSWGLECTSGEFNHRRDSGNEGEKIPLRSSGIHLCPERQPYMLHVFSLHSQKAATRLSPEFWSIHCNESMCAFKILQICWSWAERNGASHLLQHTKTKSSKRQSTTKYPSKNETTSSGSIQEWTHEEFQLFKYLLSFYAHIKKKNKAWVYRVTRVCWTSWCIQVLSDILQILCHALQLSIYVFSQFIAAKWMGTKVRIFTVNFRRSAPSHTNPGQSEPASAPFH